MGFLPELKVDGVKMAQLTPMLVYLSKVSLEILTDASLKNTSFNLMSAIIWATFLKTISSLVGSDW